MQDQVKGLNAAGIHAAFINSSLTETQIARALDLAAEGSYKLVYVAPERLESPVFRSFAAGAERARRCQAGRAPGAAHSVPACRSRSAVKGVAGGRALGEFRGLVYVAPDAQRTDARQQSRNVLLGAEARIDTKPQLEIYADDVKCTHGATVGMMDNEAILYMRQRGLSLQQARSLQIEGFVDDIVLRCPLDAVREALVGAVAEKLEKM